MKLEEMPDKARVWIFASPLPFDHESKKYIEERLGRFVSGWTSHGAPVAGASALIDDQFILIAADEEASPSGCSIDKLFKEVTDIEKEKQASLLDASRVYFRANDGTIRAVDRAGFRDLATRGEVRPDTIVFDNGVERLGDVRKGGWQKPAAESWHAQYLPGK
ncbi:MAG TPA: hypothetical protein VHL58_14820 [Thermoanaerobaculia bacterium]|nr:hypothetical protein [Thermoanaerobaculia bacterium]